MRNTKPSIKDVINIGGGQSALAVGYYLRKTDLDYLILDQQTQAWESLHLFSSAQWSSLPGILMSGGSDYYPSRDDTIRYLQYDEDRYPVADWQNPVKCRRANRYNI